MKIMKGDLNLRDISKIVLLALLQATLITGQLNHLILQESFYLYSILLAFLLFQLVILFPLGFPPLPIDDWKKLLRKIWPWILEIVLEFTFFWFFSNRINSAEYLSYGSGTFTAFHELSLIFHVILLFPLYSYCLRQEKAEMKETMNTRSFPTRNQIVQRIIMVLINVGAPFGIFFLLAWFNWDTQPIYMISMGIPLILNLVILKMFNPSSMFHPWSILKFVVLYLSWQWVCILTVAGLSSAFPWFYISLGLLSFFGLLLLQFTLVQSLERSCGIIYSGRPPISIRNSKVQGGEPSQLSEHPTLPIYCPACANQISSEGTLKLSEEKSVFCAQCGEKIHYQEVVQLPKEKILSDHQEFLKKVQQSTSDPDSHTTATDY